MFNGKKRDKVAVDDIIFVVALCIYFSLLVAGLGYALFSWITTTTETVQAEPLPTVEYEEVEPSENFTFEKVEAECEHNWVISKKDSTLIRTVNLASVASKGIEKVYLTRHRDMFEETTGDIYIAYDENLEDITLLYWDGVFEIEYFPAGVDTEIPRMEEYEFTLYECEKCNEFKHVSAEKLTMYKFYIPEGTYLISH